MVITVVVIVIIHGQRDQTHYGYSQVSSRFIHHRFIQVNSTVSVEHRNKLIHRINQSQGFERNHGT